MRKYLPLTLVLVAALAALVLPACGGANKPATQEASNAAADRPATSAANEGDRPRLEYLRLSAGQADTQKQLQMEMSMTAQQQGCRLECNGCRTVCIPGCDPPDPKGTVKGCSPCYTKEIVCDVCRKVCP